MCRTIGRSPAASPSISASAGSTSPPPTERFDRTVTGFDFQAASPIQAAALANYAKAPVAQVAVGDFRTLGGLTFAGRDGMRRGLYQTSKRNFAPRYRLRLARRLQDGGARRLRHFP